MSFLSRKNATFFKKETSFAYFLQKNVHKVPAFLRAENFQFLKTQINNTALFYFSCSKHKCKNISIKLNGGAYDRLKVRIRANVEF